MQTNRHAVLADPSRRALLDVLRGSPGPVDVRTLAGRVGLHPNSAREQLRRLAGAGLVRITAAPAAGRGRPGLLYGAAPEADSDPYRLLAGVLADELAARPDARELTIAAGERWGRQAVKGTGGASVPGSDPAGIGTTRSTDGDVAALVTLLAEAGFAPETPAPGDLELRLRACPFVPLERRHLDTVCGAHLGFLRGALRELGSGLDAVSIQPFVTPDLCTARLEVHSDA